MRIAVVAPPWFEIPPPAYGGIESMCYELVQGLVARGYEVTLIGAGRNHSDARFIATYTVRPGGIGTVGSKLHELTHAAKAARTIEAIEPDVVHDHPLAGPLTATRHPTVVTVHGPVGADGAAFYRNLAPSVHLTACRRHSAAKRRIFAGPASSATGSGSLPIPSARGRSHTSYS
jgi:glycosyltransferase involved in cell wall biosynthesis